MGRFRASGRFPVNANHRLIDAEVERLIEEGKVVSAVRLSGRLTGDSTFTLKR